MRKKNINNINYEEKYYKFIPIILYFVIDDSKTENLTIKHPIGGNEREIYANNFKKKINNTLDKNMLKYIFKFNEIPDNKKIIEINEIQDTNIICEDNFYIIRSNNLLKKNLNLINKYKNIQYILD